MARTGVLRWVWNGAFSLAIPDGWVLRELDDLIEIVPPGPIGALHISFMQRACPGLMADGEAAQLVLAVSGALGGLKPRVQERDLGHQRLARTDFATDDRCRLIFWDVATQVWEQYALVASYSHDGSQPGLRLAAMEILGSIQARL